MQHSPRLCTVHSPHSSTHGKPLPSLRRYQKRLQANLYTLAKLADLQAKPAPAQQPAAAPPQ